MNRKLTFSLIIGLVALGSHASQTGSSDFGQLKSRALMELGWLANAAPAHGALIFQAEQTKAFVQFSGQELSLDLPQAILSEDQLSTATSVLLPFGIETFTYPVGSGPSKELHHSFYKNFEGDIGQAWEIVRLVFEKVFELDEDAMISITRIE